MEMQEKKALLFSNKDLKKLIWPLIIEQLLTVTVGMMDTVMIASVGESAVSAVSLVDSIMILIIQIFAAIATGGAVVAGQFLGAKDEDCACQSANQLVLFISVLSVAVMGLVYLLRGFILHQVFGKITAEVMAHSSTYLDIVSLSIPFIALYNGGAALFRTMGNSRISMYTSLLMNAINITGNAIMIYGLHMGVAGAAIPTLVSRIVAAVVMIVLLLNPKQLVHLKRPFSLKFESMLIKRILYIGVPNGLENGMFQVGKVLVSSLIAVFGTSAITANAIANNLAQFECIPGSAMGLAMITVIGRCVGAKDYKQARYYAKRLMIITYISMTAICILLSALIVPIVKLYNPSQETFNLAVWLGLYHGACGILIWPASFALPNILRAANDVRFTMTVSIISMWLCRILFSYVLALWCGLGLKGVWIAMTMDWVVRAALFIWRYFSGKWETKQLLS